MRILLPFSSKYAKLVDDLAGVCNEKGVKGIYIYCLKISPYSQPVLSLLS